MDLRRLWHGAVDVGRRVKESGLSINAAAVAYNAFLALVPLAISLLGVAALIGQSDSAVGRVERTLDPIVPGAVKDFVVELMVDAGDRFGGGSIWLVLGSVVVALFLGSRAVAALQKALAAVSDHVERRPALEMRLVAVGLTVGGGLALVLTSTTLVVGRHFIQFIAGLTPVLGFLDDVWAWLRVPLAGIGVYLFLLAVYRFGPPKPLERAWLAALVATVGALLGSLGFGLYLSQTPELGATFGVLGAVAVALVWLYLGAMAILAGAVAVLHVIPESVGRRSAP